MRESQCGGYGGGKVIKLKALEPIRSAVMCASAEPIDSTGQYNDTVVGLIDDGVQKHRAYIKLLGSDRQLFNELLVAHIGRALSLPIPVPYVVRIDSSLLPESLQPPNVASPPTKGFASIDKGSPSLRRLLDENGSPGVAQRLFRDWKRFDDVAVFDEWLANIDRNAGNLLVHSPEEFWLIDHGHCLTGPNWKSGDLDPFGQFQNRLLAEANNTLNLIEKSNICSSAIDCQSSFSGVDIAEAVKEARKAGDWSNTDMAAVEHFAKSRIPHVGKLVAGQLGVAGPLGRENV